jgi:hypothetical protein
MTKEFNGHLYETVEDWHPIIIRNKSNFMDDIILRPAWLSKHCPDGPYDYDAWVYGDDNLMDSNHRTIYFFRDEKVAMLFALRWM